jgi:N6-adenosine-specific RNA methylase IME4
VRRPKALSTAERDRLAELEQVVDQGLRVVVAVAGALLEIRDGRLYRETHTRFEDYVRDRFGFARRTAYGYIEAAQVLENVPPEAHLSLSHLRALAPLPPDAQRELAGAIADLSVAQARRILKEHRLASRTGREAKPSPPLPAGKFRTIVADPPWRYEHDWGDGLAADHYATLELDEIKSLNVASVAADESHLYLWAPVTKIPDAIAVCEAWGFTYKSLLTWVKNGLGLGTYFRVTTEHVVFGVRNGLRTSPNHRNWFEAPRSRHSAKPDTFFEDLVMQASPGPYLELFARKRRDGWTCWGDELDSL